MDIHELFDLPFPLIEIDGSELKSLKLNLIWGLDKWGSVDNIGFNTVFPATFLACKCVKEKIIFYCFKACRYNKTKDILFIDLDNNKYYLTKSEATNRITNKKCQDTNDNIYHCNLKSINIDNLLSISKALSLIN